MKIGLVTPYIYPLPGGVNAHVRYLYENLIARGHDVRIISSIHGPQRQSEGDIIRLGYGFSVPANGSVGTLTFSPRYASQVREMLEREKFDVLHFHEPFVPFLSLVLLRESQSINVATFHAFAGWSPAYEFGKRMLARFARRLHGRIAVSAVARHFIDRYFPGDYKVIPNGVDVDRLAHAQPIARYPRRHPEHPLRRAVREPQGRDVPVEGLSAAAQARHQLPPAAGRHRAPGTRDQALHRHAPARRSRAPRPDQRRRQGALLRDGRRVRLAGDRGRSPSASCCSRRWPPARRSCAATSTATRASCGATSRRCWCRRRTSRR